MADMESLEDMLAALEGPSQGEYNDLDNISNIDDFLDQIEEEARMSNKSQPRAGYDDVDHSHPQGRSQASYQPQRGAAQSTSQPVRQHPPPQQQNRQQQQQQQQQQQRVQVSNVQPARAPAPSNAQPSRAAAGAQPARNVPGPRGGNGEADLEAQGYEHHNNKGKWINNAGGKASDFRIKGTTSTRVGLAHVITLRALDDYGNPARVENPRDFIGCILTHTQSGNELQCWYRDNGNCEYDLAFCSDRPGSVRMEIKLAGNPMFDIEIQVEDIGTSIWVAKPRLPAKPKELFIIDIETIDGSRPEGVAPFEVQTVGSVENLRLINNGDGTYRFQCVPQSHEHVTVQLTLHGQPIKNSPVSVRVGDKVPMKIRQESTHVETISDTRPGYGNERREYEADTAEEYGGGDYDAYGNVANYRGSADVSNEDLNRLLDELGG